MGLELLFGASVKNEISPLLLILAKKYNIGGTPIAFFSAKRAILHCPVPYAPGVFFVLLSKPLILLRLVHCCILTYATLFYCRLLALSLISTIIFIKQLLFRILLTTQLTIIKMQSS